MNDKIITIQQELKVPKVQRNTFGNYNYRSCEDILEALKPLLKAEGLLLTMSDEVVNIGNRNYVKATVRISSGDQKSGIGEALSAMSFKEFTAFAREDEIKKGMSGDQITGAASSYARKYALNGIFLIDDTKDSDSTNDGKEDKKPTQATTASSTDIKCPRCGGDMWDNRKDKKNPKAPDYKCKNNDCKDSKGYVTAIWEKKDEIPSRDINADKVVTANTDDEEEAMDSLLNGIEEL